jgi:hypothetical protein
MVRPINLTSKAERIWKWIFVTVPIALSPVIATYLISLLNWGLTGHGWPDLIANISPHGELLIVAVALVAESVSDMWRRQICGWQKDGIAGCCITFVIIGSLIFSGLNPNPNNAIVISTTSVDVFMFGFGLCIACKLAGRS